MGNDFKAGDISFNYYDIPHVEPMPEWIQKIVYEDSTSFEFNIEGSITQIIECLHLVGKTRSPRVFFERYDFDLALLFRGGSHLRATSNLDTILF